MRIQYLDTCLSDYFQGFNGRVYCVLAHDGQTIGDIRAGLIEAINAEMDYTEGTLEAVDAYFNEHELDNYASPVGSLPTLDDDDDTEFPYHYFGLVQND